MSGSQIGGVIGGVIGAYFGGNWQLGYAIGSAIGGMVDPTTTYGPRLSEATTQTAMAGGFIPKGWGTFPVSGNIMWQGKINEHKKKKAAKGSGQEQVTYTYSRSYAIRICQGPITGLLIARRNGKVVYDARPDSVLHDELSRQGIFETAISRLISEQRASNGKFSEKFKVYLGTESQLPDPTIEAQKGAGNVPAYRSIAYLVADEDDTQSGEVAQWEFVVTAEGTAVVTPGTGNILAASNGSGLLRTSKTGDEWTDPIIDTGLSLLGDVSTTRIYNVGGITFHLGIGIGRAFNSESGSWVTISGMPAGQVNSMAFCKGRWYMFMESGIECHVSMSGFAFAPVTMNESRSRFGSAVIGETIVVASTNSYVSVSTGMGVDGTWSTIATGLGGDVCSVVPTGTRFLSFSGASNDGIAYSDDATGENWNVATYPGQGPGVEIRALEFNDGLGIAILSNSDTIYTVDEGITWLEGGPLLPGDVPANSYGSAFKCFNHLFICALAADKIATTTNGIEWTTIELSVADGTDVSSVATQSGMTELPDAPGNYIDAAGNLVIGDHVTVTPDVVPLGSIVAYLCRREGLATNEYDVSQLTDLVPGFRIASEAGASDIIAPLSMAYFFDYGEWDGKLHFVKRGADPVATITHNDLIEREGDAYEVTRSQEVELLRKVTVRYLDPLAAYTVMTQEWERRTRVIEARGEQTTEIPVVLDGDTAARIAHKRGKAAWAEREKQKFGLSVKWSDLTATDVVVYQDEEGRQSRIRLMENSEDSGVISLESSENRQSTYTSNVSGAVPPARTPAEPTVIGPTLVQYMALPVWSGDADDRLGLYVAARGILGGWRGARIMGSQDSGASYDPIADIEASANMGSTTTALSAWVSPEYPSHQSLTVSLPEPPDSMDYAAMLTYRNLAAIRLDSGAWSILQWQTVSDDGNGNYTLRDIVHGRFNTNPGSASPGSPFVVLDGAVEFVPFERAQLGTSIKAKAVSYGTTLDNTTEQDVLLTGESQTEWPVHGVEAARDDADNVAVTWIGRARLGTETSPHHSDYFAGYRVSWDDGTAVTTADTIAESYTITSVPDPITVTVAPLNSITGAGPESTGIPA